MARRATQFLKMNHLKDNAYPGADISATTPSVTFKATFENLFVCRGCTDDHLPCVIVSVQFTPFVPSFLSRIFSLTNNGETVPSGSKTVATRMKSNFAGRWITLKPIVSVLVIHMIPRTISSGYGDKEWAGGIGDGPSPPVSFRINSEELEIHRCNLKSALSRQSRTKEASGPSSTLRRCRQPRVRRRFLE